MRLITENRKVSSSVFTILLIVVFVVSFFAFGIWVKQKMPNGAFFLARPFDYLVQKMDRLGTAVFRPRTILNDNETLSQRNIQLEAQLTDLETLKAENEFLRSQLGLAKPQKRLFIEAKIIGFDILPTYHIVFINAGAMQNVRDGAAIVAEAGTLVGRIIKLEKERSQVLLISDPKSRVAVTTNKKISGVLVGQLKDELILDLVPIGQQIEIGDTLVSSGIDGLYPTDLPIGKIAKIITKETDAYQKAVVEPFVNLQNARRVLIIQ